VEVSSFRGLDRAPKNHTSDIAARSHKDEPMKIEIEYCGM